MTTFMKETCFASKRKGMSDFCNSGQLPMTAGSRNPSRTALAGPAVEVGAQGGARESREEEGGHFLAPLFWYYLHVLKQVCISSENKGMSTRGVKLQLLLPGVSTLSPGLRSVSQGAGPGEFEYQISHEQMLKINEIIFVPAVPPGLTWLLVKK